jgi:multiple sugar transport system ATP-binding protein
MAFLEIRNVAHSYGKTAVLHGVDLEIEQGEFVVLVGPSGCGKSTLLSLVAGLETLQHGDIAVRGVSIAARSPAERDIAMVFQSYALYPNMTVAENLGFGLRMRGVARPAREVAIAEVAELLKLQDLLKRKPRELSGGQRQRVAMGRALVRRPQLFLFDEPLSNLDARLRIEMRALIKRLHQQFKTTTVYVTHDQIEAMTLATRIAVMNGGALQQVGEPRAVYDRPANTFVAGFMGAPPMNLVPATLVERDDAASVCVALGGRREATLRLPERVRAREHAPEVVLGLRPEAITAAETAPRGAELVEATVELVEPAGSDTFVVTRIADRDVVARLPGDAQVRAGESFRFALDMTRAVLFDAVTGVRLDASADAHA